MIYLFRKIGELTLELISQQYIGVNMEIVTTLINTFLLIALFWYQKNKNKVLEDRIAEQSNLLRETKDVVTNQAQAIESQKIVVDTAIQYSSNFDLQKIESIISRELDLEYKETIRKQQEQIAQHEQSLSQTTEKFESFVTTAIEHFTSDYIGPLSGELYHFLIAAPDDVRQETLSKIPVAISQAFRVSLEELDKIMLERSE